MVQNGFFDAGLSSVNKIRWSTGSSPPGSRASPDSPTMNSTLAGESLSRPTWLFSSQAAYTNSPTDALSSILDSFSPFDSDLSNQLGAQYKQMTNRLSQRRPYGVLMSPGGAESPMNPLGAPGTPVNNSHSMPSTPSGNIPPPKNPKLYKTELCRTWMEYGRCNYGERCQYAHGEAEKRPIPRHPKYKTEACQSFHLKGVCPYGPRCHFIHNEVEYLARLDPLSSPFPSMFPSTVMRAASGPGGPAMTPGAPHMKPMAPPPLHRMTSLPNYGSAGESSSGSSADSGSESPNGSFSPGLELDECGPFTAGFMTPQQHLMRQNSSTAYSAFDTKYDGLLSDLLVGIKFDDHDGASGRLPVFTQLSTGK